MRRFRSRVVSNCRSVLRIVVTLLGIVPFALPVAAADSDKEAKAQLGFGVDMARRGLWKEALFRFEQVRKLRPDDPKAINNLAVAYEAVGRFDDAEPLYREAERLAPSNRDIKKNHARFKEFLNQFRAKKPAGQAPEEKKEESKP